MNLSITDITSTGSYLHLTINHRNWSTFNKKINTKILKPMFQ